MKTKLKQSSVEIEPAAYILLDSRRHHLRSRRILTCVALIAVAATVGACVDRRELVTGDQLTALEGATLIDGTGGPPVASAAVILSGKQILRVGRVGQFRYPSGVTVHDLSGRYIIPGFIDMHVHPRVGAERATMQMLLAFGITTVRIPGLGFDAPDDLGLRLRDQIARDELVGPRVFTGGKIIEGPRKTFPDDVEVRSEVEMRAEVRRQAALGVDLVKLYWSTPIEFIRAAVDEAHSLGLQVVGHLRQTSWTEAARVGIDGLVHSAGDGPSWELAPPGSRDELRVLPYRQRYARLQELVKLDSPWFRDLAIALVDNHVTVDPTLVIMQTLYFGDDLSVLHRLEPELAPPAVLASWGKNWDKGNPFVLENVGSQDLTYGKGMFTMALGIVRQFHERGVRLAAGTDVGMPWITPGVSFHRELELLVQAGIPPSQVLLIATKNGAEGLRTLTKFGTIAPGMSADLLVLRDDPTRDIHNTRSIEAVYKEGQRFDPRALLSQLR